MDRHDPTNPANRRDFLQAAGLAAGAAALAGSARAAQPAAQTLPTVRLGKHEVTRLIIGGNPIYGHSHFNRLLSRAMTDYHTPERVQELLRRCEQAGLNTWQNSYAERTLQDLERYRMAGGRMHWLCLGKPDWDRHPEHIDDAAKRKPIGIAPHGALAERLHRQNRLDVLTTLLRRIRDRGVLVGLSAHNPDLIRLAEDRNWDVDYYMCCLYYLTRPRDEFRKILGKDLPLGEIYLPADPPRMFEVVRAVRKPCLVYKVMAAGRRVNTPAEIRECFATALNRIKPTDAMIVGMFQQFGDQVGENAALVRELCNRRR
ncbi:MAG: twin-arginine translocation signal domain-containing protein [Gemmataceae bacterium]|nr:twin-arginine translocation signal domain-containing protein [Gemmataceae bacterium]